MSLSNRDDDTDLAAIRARLNASAARHRADSHGKNMADFMGQENAFGALYGTDDSEEVGGDPVYRAFHDYGGGNVPATPPKRQVGPRRPRIGRRRLGVALGVVTLCLLTWAFLLAWGGGSSAALWLVLGGLVLCAAAGMYLGPKEGE